MIHSGRGHPVASCHSNSLTDRHKTNIRWAEEVLDDPCWSWALFCQLSSLASFAALDVFAAFALQFLVECTEARPRAFIQACGVFVNL